MVAVIDLFAGIGGLSIGAYWAGGDVRLMVDNDPIACSTLRLNPNWCKGDVHEADIADLSGKEIRSLAGLSQSTPLVVIGGPPCQPFSKNAYWQDAGDESRFRQARARGESVSRPTCITTPRPDARRCLIYEFWRQVEETEADGFVFENVPSILHPRNRSTIDSLIEMAHLSGFKTNLLKANAADFGVPQCRHRVFILGVRGAKPRTPAPTHGANSSANSNLLPIVTAGEAISRYSDSCHFEPEEVVTGRWAEHLKSIPPGWNYKAHTAWGGHPNPTFVTETRFWHFLLKLSPDLPSWTIAASPGPWTGPFHWDSRRLRTPELAALQGFPHGYQFAGNRRDRVRQIGNAVPPLMAQRMIEPVIELLQKPSKQVPHADGEKQ